MTSIVERIYHHATQTPDKAAVIFEGAAATYGELWSITVRCAQLLKKLGVGEGGRVVCQCRYDPYFWALRFAAHLCGAAFAPADKDTDARRLSDFAALLDARLVISNVKDEAIPRGVSYDELADMLPKDATMEGLSFPKPDSVSDIVFTTGTTGASKGVQLTQRCMAARAISNAREYGVRPDDVTITMVPLNHIAPIMVLDQRVIRGSTIIFLDGMMKLKLMFDYMDKFGVTCIFLPPTGVTLIQRLSQNRLADYADQLEYFSTGSAAMTKPQQEYVKRMLPHSRLYCCYASSECGIVSVHRYDEAAKDVACCGKPCAEADLRLVDDAFRPVPAGSVGLIAVKSDMNMLGYYNRPELNDAVFHDGYFITSDLGCLDEEGFLYILGRNDDMINIGGLKVFPSEIENAALRIPGIDECICFGVPDPVTGQAAKLLVKTNDAFSGSAELVMDALSRTIDYYKVPKCVEIVAEIAKTANGKPDRKRYQTISA